MSSTAQAVKNAATALKKATDPWNKEGRETAERIVTAAISVTDAPSLSQDILNMLSGLLRRPFAELYLTYPGAALRLSAAIFTTIVHDRIAQSWKARDTQSRSNWEQIAVILLAGVQDHVEAHSNERVKLIVAQAYFAILCNAFFSVSSTIPLSTYSISLRVSAYSLLSMTADGCAENENKLRDSKILGGAKLGRVITSTKDYLALEQLLILLAYLLPLTEGKAAGRAERLGFLRECFQDSTQRGKDLIELLKYVASPDWEVTADKIVDILARDISVAQPFLMKSFVLNGSPNLPPNPANRFYLDRTSFLFNCEDEDGKIEGMHVPYDSIRHVDISNSGTVAARLLSPPQLHESLQIISNDVAITMTVMIASEDVKHFIRTLRIRGMASRIRLNGMSIQRATVRTSVNISPTRLEFEDNAPSVASYQNKVKVVEEGVLQASDPGDDIVPNLEVCINKLQNEQPLLVKDRTSSPDLPSTSAPVTIHGTKVHYDGSCHHVSSASGHQLSNVHEDPQNCSTTPSLAAGPGPSPRSADPPSLHSPRAFSAPYRCYDGNNITSVHSSPSGHSHHDRASDKELGDAVFGASDEELSSLSDTESIFCTAQPSSALAQSRRITRGSGSSKRHLRSQRRRHPHLPSKRTSPASDPSPPQDPAPEQKLAPMVKRLRVIDSQDSTRDKPSDRGAAAAKRKKILIDSEDEIEPATCVPSIVKELPSKPTSDPSQEKKVAGKKRQSSATTTQDRVASERPRRACVATNSSNVGASVQTKPHTPVVVDQSDSNKARSENELVGDRDKDNRANDTSRKIAPGENVAEQQEPAQMVESQSKDAEGDVPLTSKRGRGRPRKRARIEPEDISPPRNRPHRSNKDTFVSKPRKAPPSRARKTYRNRQKTERSSLSHCVNPDVDYDEIPPSTAALNSPTARTLTPKESTDDIPASRPPLQVKSTNVKTIIQRSPSVEPRPANEIPGDKKQEMGMPNQLDACLVQAPPAEVVTDDDDPIQSFSSSPSKLLSLAVDAPKPEVSLPCDAGVRSDCLSPTGSPVKSLDVTSTAEIMPTHTMKSVITKTESDMTSQPAACDNMLQDPNAEEASTSTEMQSTSTPAAANDKAQESPKAFADLDYLDGPTAITEPSEPQETENNSAAPRSIVDLTGSTPSPIRSPVSRCAEDKVPSPHDVPSPTGSNSPVLSKGRASEDNTNSSLLSLTDTKYQDFDVSLDSSLCLPSNNRNSSIKRTPTPPPPPRSKRKSVTFAAPLEKVVGGRLGTPAAPAPTITDNFDELEYLELAPEPARGNGSSRVDGFHDLSKRLTIEPQHIHLSSPPTSLTAEPLSLLSFPLTLCQSRPYLTRAPLSTAARAKQKPRARDVSLSPTVRAESIAGGSYLIPIMEVLDEIHDTIKNNIQTRFERLNSNVVELRRQILGQTQADLTALLDEYIAAFNDLVSLEAKYGTFSRRRIAAFTQARDNDTQSLSLLRAQIQTHDLVMQAHARHTFSVGPLPRAVRRWL